MHRARACTHLCLRKILLVARQACTCLHPACCWLLAISITSGSHRAADRRRRNKQPIRHALPPGTYLRWLLPRSLTPAVCFLAAAVCVFHARQTTRRRRRPETCNGAAGLGPPMGSEDAAPEQEQHRSSAFALRQQ